jgi:hypothetical protein
VADVVGNVVEGLVDFHIHSAPSIVPRHTADPETLDAARSLGVQTFVLKAHEGSSADRAQLLGPEVVGGVVLNSTIGGANPDAVEVAARLGARVVWLPTISSPAHKAANESPELQAHAGITFRAVPVVDDGQLRAEWYDVLDVVARHGMVLCTGHVTIDEAIVVLTEARRRGVDRLLVNHPGLGFLGWRDEHAEPLRALGAYLEVGVLADILAGADGTTTARLAAVADPDLFVFGSDLGHAHYPPLAEGVLPWLQGVAGMVGESTLERLAVGNARELLRP